MLKNNQTIKVNSIWDYLEYKDRRDLFDLVVSKEAKRKRKNQ